jgi:hypothetical protein
MPELPYGSSPVPATPVWQLKGWVFDVRCSRCRRHTVLHVSDLVAQAHGTSYEIQHIETRHHDDGDETENVRPWPHGRTRSPNTSCPTDEQTGRTQARSGNRKTQLHLERTRRAIRGW